jgi:FAD/FMN-containing dehydrogenase
MDPKKLQNRIEGRVIISTDAAYPKLRRDVVWPRNTPGRHPRLIVQVASQNDVIEAVKFARSAGMKVAVRGGGHSWVGFSLRDDSLLIDLGRLKQVSIDRGARTARIQPAITGQELNRMLEAEGMAFPVGHCGTVALSGFLLSGGIGWNFNAWDPSCFSIIAAKLAMADGDLVVASEQENPDLLWAIRGGGPGFFGVVTEYSLRLYGAPRAITTSNYYYSLEVIEEIGAWAGDVAPKLPKNVELTIIIAAAPPPIADQCQSGNGFACIVSATAFVDNAEESAATRKLLDSCPSATRCLLAERDLSTPISRLHEVGAISYPEGLRYLADTLWTKSSPGEVARALRENFMSASAKCTAFFGFVTGASHKPFPDAAYSMRADALLLCYAIWDQPEDDAASATWHRATIAALDQYAVGHYVGESDIIADPRRAERSYAKANWQRLQALRQQYDPDGLFHGHFAAN